MITWSIQKTSVVEQALNEGLYQPDFKKSTFVKQNPQLLALYDLLVTGFNVHNHVHVPGVIFGFFRTDGQQVYEIRSIEEFGEFLYRNRPVMKALLESYDGRDYEIVMLDYPDNVQPLFIDINDFQYIMPPEVVVPPFTENDVDRIKYQLITNQPGVSRLPTEVIQGHFANIRRENIVGRYTFQAL